MHQRRSRRVIGASATGSALTSGPTPRQRRPVKAIAVTRPQLRARHSHREIKRQFCKIVGGVFAGLRVKTDYEGRGPHASPRVITHPDEQDMRMILDDIARLRREVDIVVVAFHWGVIWVPRVIADGSYWVPGWWEEVWVASLQGLYDSRRGRRKPATGREDLRIWRHRIWSTSWH